MAQTYLPFHIPCHETIDYDDPNWKQKTDNLPQCVGHAMLRKEEGLENTLPPNLLLLDGNGNHFESIHHWWAHHKQVSLGEARSELKIANIVAMCFNEMTRTGVRFVKPPIPETGEGN